MITPQDLDRAKFKFASGISFHVASEAIWKAQEPMFHWPAYLLNTCFSLELSTKAYLASRGHTDAQLKKIGHDLSRGLQAAQEDGFTPSSQLLAQLVDHLSPSHVNGEFRYLAEGGFDVVDPALSLALVKQHYLDVGAQIPIHGFTQPSPPPRS